MTARNMPMKPRGPASGRPAATGLPAITACVPIILQQRIGDGTMTDGPKINLSLDTDSDAQVAGRLLALEIAVAQLVSASPDPRGLLKRMETAGDRIETGYGSHIPRVRLMGTACRQAMERIATMATMVRNKLDPDQD